MEELEQPIKVYIKINSNNDIVEINSEIFIQDPINETYDIFIEGFINWIYLDEGFGDKYAHAQSQYFEKPLINEEGKYNYKYENGEIKEE